MKDTASNRFYHLIVGKKMAIETTTVLQFVNKVYFMDLVFRNFDVAGVLQKAGDSNSRARNKSQV